MSGTITKTSTNLTNLFLDATNIYEARIKNNQGKFLNFDIAYQDGGNKGTLFFTLMFCEAQFLLNDPDFLPWFDDGNRCFRIVGDGIFIIPTYRAIEGEAQTARITMRHKELFPLLKQAMEIPEGTSIEFSREIKRSAEMAVPKFSVDHANGAVQIIADNRADIDACVERVEVIARNYSTGQDDPMFLTFYPDGEKSLYFVIVNKDGKRALNGGIIWHGDDETGSYSIHT